MEPEIPMLDVEILIGFDCPEALEPLKVITGRKGTLFGFKSRLGWGIIGMTPEASNNSPQANEHKATINHSIVVFRSETKELHKLEDIRKILKGDFVERRGQQKAYSQEDRTFMDILQQGIVHGENGHYKLPLPLKGQFAKPNNKELVLSRAQSLKRKMQRNDAFKRDYFAFMNTILSKGYADRLPQHELIKEQIWYLPHH
ncbi:UNVERIFIED_CONTAM: hypothetical protein RMT77_005862 [Armadillidium vulgare]